MPFRSEAQRRFLWAKHPDIAKRWTAEYGSTPQPSSGQGQKHHAQTDFKLSPGPVARHTPKRATEQQAEREGTGISVVPGAHAGPLAAVGNYKGLRRRDVRQAARAKLGRKANGH